MWLKQEDTIENKNAGAFLLPEPDHYSGVVRCNVTVTDSQSYTDRNGQVQEGRNASLMVGLFRGGDLQVTLDLEGSLRGGVEADSVTRIGIDIKAKLFWLQHVAGKTLIKAADDINKAGLWVNMTLTAHTCKSKSGNVYSRIVISHFVARKATEDEMAGVPQILDLGNGILHPTVAAEPTE